MDFVFLKNVLVVECYFGFRRARIKAELQCSMIAVVPEVTTGPHYDNALKSRPQLRNILQCPSEIPTTHHPPRPSLS